jgi:hypothetical protein
VALGRARAGQRLLERRLGACGLCLRNRHGSCYGEETQKEGELDAPARPIGEVFKYPGGLWSLEVIIITAKDRIAPVFYHLLQFWTGLPLFS